MIAAAASVSFLSGFCSLVYQVSWQRVLVVFSGADVYATTIVVAAFMAGLGCGSLAGGHIADRLSRHASLALFGATEAGIALFGWQSTFVLYTLLYQRLGHLASGPVPMASVLFLSLLCPTFLMGASLPLLSRAFARRASTAPRTIGGLYTTNTLGAASGALATTWWLIPSRGLEGGVKTAALINAACAVGSLALAAIVLLKDDDKESAGCRTAPDEPSVAGISPRHERPFAAWCTLYALSGFIALSFEIVWFRLLGVMLKSTAFTFGTLLAQYLCWLGLGAALGSWGVARMRRPGIWFLALHALAGLYSGLILAFVIGKLNEFESLLRLYTYLGLYEPFNAREAASAMAGFALPSTWAAPEFQSLLRDFLGLYVALPAVLVGVPSLLMGMAFPLLQAVVQTEFGRIGRRVGVLLGANIIAGMAGSLVTSWWLLGWLGSAGTLRLLVAASGIFSLMAIALMRSGPAARRLASAGAVIVFAGVVVAMPTSQILWSQVHGSPPDAMLIAEDQSGLSALKGTAAGDFTQAVGVYVNGVGQSRIPYGGIHTILGALPAFLHPSPREAAIIGLGSGDTAFSVAGRADLRRIAVIEIVASQVKTLSILAERQPYYGLLQVLRDPRIEHISGDGRAVLKRSGRKFDILEADALRSTSAYAGYLYSEEYFALLLTHLNPGGLAVTWLASDRTERTFLKVFPYAIRFPEILIGSNQPIDFDRRRVAERISNPAVRAYYELAGIDIVATLNGELKNGVALGPDPRRLMDRDINTDLMPRDESGVP